MTDKLRQIGEDAEALVGRKIEGAYINSSLIVLNLGDGVYLKCEPAHDYDDGVQLEYGEEASPWELHEVGMITEAEKAAMDERIESERVDASRERELSTLHRLMEKYPVSALDLDKGDK